MMIKGLSIGKKHSLLALSTIKRVFLSSLNQKLSLSEDPALEFPWEKTETASFKVPSTNTNIKQTSQLR